jgi:hypothetical protein
MASGRQPAVMPEPEVASRLGNPTTDRARRAGPESDRAPPREVKPAVTNGSTAPRPDLPATSPVPARPPEAMPDGSQRYLAPALKAAAVARARTARIRATTEGHAPAPRGHPSAAGWVARPIVPSPPSTTAPPPRPAAAGLTVAEARRAARIAFRPLRGEPEKPSYGTDYDREVTRTAPEEVALPRSDTEDSPIEAGGKGEPPGASVTDDAGTARAGSEDQRRFGRTLAELERFRAASREREPWSNVVPRPAAAAPAQPGALREDCSKGVRADPEPAPPWSNVVPRPAAGPPSRPPAAGDEPAPWSSVVPRPAGPQTADRTAGAGESAWGRLWRRRKAGDPD